MPPRAEEICDGSTAVYWAAWLALTPPLKDSAVRPRGSGRGVPRGGRACPLKVATAVAAAAATAVVRTAAMITSRYALIRGSVSDRCAKPIKA